MDYLQRVQLFVRTPSSDAFALRQQLSLVMAEQAYLRTLISKWTTDSDGFKAEARRLELSDLSRHATSVVMLEAYAQAIDRCILEVENLIQSG